MGRMDKPVRTLGLGGTTTSPGFYGMCGRMATVENSAMSELGVGKSFVLNHDLGTAVRHFMCGMGIAIPWALGIVMLGAARSETWVRYWWHPLIAIQPAISEEAWGRLLLVPLFYFLTRRVYKPRAAFTAALVIIGYWLAFFHTVGSSGALFNTLFTGTLYVLPVSYLCLYRDFETAIGFHFCIDFIKFLSAYIMFSTG